MAYCPLRYPDADFERTESNRWVEPVCLLTAKDVLCEIGGECEKRAPKMEAQSLSVILPTTRGGWGESYFFNEGASPVRHLRT